MAAIHFETATDEESVAYSHAKAFNDMMAAHTKDTLRIQGAATTRACSHDKIMVFYAGTYRVRELVDTVLL